MKSIKGRPVKANSHWNFWQRLRFSFSLGILSTAFTALPSLAAERIVFTYPPFGDFYISIKSLEIFAEQGEISNDLSFYAGNANPEQLNAVRDVLTRRFKVSPVTVSQFTYSPIGETILKRLGDVLKGDPNQNGFHALRAAFIVGATQPEGLNVIDMLKRFPLRTIRIDLPLTLQVANEVSRLFTESNAIVMGIHDEAVKMSESNPQNLDDATQIDLRQSGMFAWQKISFTTTNPNRTNEPLPVDVYLPRGNSEPAPVIVISHGLASDRTTFAYLGKHLASYGFAVALVEHPGTNTESIGRFFVGLGSSPDVKLWTNRPLDVKYLLDDLEQKSQTDPVWQGRLNMQQVGILGQSLGGYTALAVAGAPINFAQLDRDCSNLEPRSLSLNLSLAFQCQAAELPSTSGNLQDPRIKAAIAVNPLSSSIFGQESLSKITIPLMFVGSSNDYFTPIVSEQIYPFMWLTTAAKYLVVLENGTHFSFLEQPSQQSVLPVPANLIGPNTQLSRSYLQALSTAFFKTHLANQPQYQSYLTGTYVNEIAQEPFKLSLIKSLTMDQLQQAIAASTTK